MQGRGIQGESADLIIQALRQSTKKQNECYLRKWLKFSDSREIHPPQPSVNIVIEFLYDLYESGVQYSGIGTAKSAKTMLLNIAQQFMKELVKIYFGLLNIQVKFLIN